MFLLMSLSCATVHSEDSAIESTFQSCTDGDNITLVISTFNYARREDGIVWGFNLDEHITESDDEEGCYKEDLIDPYGNEGVDNAFSGLIPALESTEAIALESLIQASINSGELLLIIEINGIQDWQNDECVSVGIYRGRGIPLVGTEGTLLDGQTFERAYDLPYSTITNIEITDGKLDALPLSIELPVQVLDEFLELEMNDGGLHIELDSSGGAFGFFGGAIPIQILNNIVSLPDVNLPEAVITLLGAAADLFPDEGGTCQSISMAFEYAAIPAHFYPQDQQ
jgi:hypothetical protein